ncbi:MAG: VWA domain-containing protein, partial [Gemmatimonadetes bacterium]|nr:VWA domain-containing protein [Gemmatimonadota bacterium]
LQIRQSRRLRVREILLLLLRILMLALLAIAFARPALQGPLARGLGGTVRSSACVVLDASYSMSFDEGGEPLLAKAKGRGREVAALLDEGDEAFLVFGGDAPESRFETATHNLRLLETEIQKAPQSWQGGDMTRSFREAYRTLAGSRNANREIYWISDMQRVSSAIEEGEWEAFMDPAVRVFLVPVGETDRPNLAVTKAELYESRRLDGNVKIQVEVANYSGEKRDVLASLWAGEERLANASLAIDAGSAQTTIFSMQAPKGGVVLGEIRIEEDDLPADDVFYFTLAEQERLPVLVVTDGIDESYGYLQKALLPAGEESPVRLENAAPRDLAGRDLNRYASVILLGVRTLSEGAAALLEEYVAAGGGVLIVPGDATDFGAYNQVLLPALMSGVTLSESIVEHRRSPVGIEWFDPLHTVWALFPKGIDRALREVALSRYLDVKPGEESRPLAKTGDGRPFLLESEKGAGRVMLFAGGFDLSWGDFPTQPVFLPLLHELVRYHDRGGALTRTSVLVNRPFRRSLDGVSLGESFTVVDPSGQEFTVQPAAEGERIALSFAGTREPGFYELRGPGRSEWFAVNLDTRESDLTPMDPDELARALPVEGVVVVTPRERIDRSVLGTRFGRELWWELIVLVLALALFELFLSQSSRQAVPQES